MSNFWLNRRDKADAIVEAVIERHRHLGVQAVRSLIDDLILQFEIGAVEEAMENIQKDFAELKKSLSQ